MHRPFNCSAVARLAILLGLIFAAGFRLPVRATALEAAQATVEGPDAAALRLETQPAWARAFLRAGATGTFVLYDLRTGRLKAFDLARAQTPFIPASTFKIPNALLALEAGLVKDENAPWVWDGVSRPMQAWNRNHTLRTGMKYSVVPLFQELARQLGPERILEGLTRLGYGNRDISGGIDRFWLDGGLRISALEQVLFLARLYRLELPVSERSQRIVRELILVEASAEYVLRAKTGYAQRQARGIGWYVGWVEREDGAACFALNIDITHEKLLPERIAISRALLKREGLLP